jgi:hypothetical protein
MTTTAATELDCFGREIKLARVTPEGWHISRLTSQGEPFHSYYRFGSGAAKLLVMATRGSWEWSITDNGYTVDSFTAVLTEPIPTATQAMRKAEASARKHKIMLF